MSNFNEEIGVGSSSNRAYGVPAEWQLEMDEATRITVAKAESKHIVVLAGVSYSTLLDRQLACRKPSSKITGILVRVRTVLV